MRKAVTGDTVRVHYSGTLDDGSEFDNSEQSGPIELEIGGGQIFPILENSLVGMAEGETNRVTLGPDDAYGAREPQLVQSVPRDRIPPEIQLEIGTVLQTTNDNGDRIRLVVVDVDDDHATLDANHPLAGKTLNFSLTLVEFVG